jgi:DNA-binding transcriptional LysR family regulator
VTNKPSLHHLRCFVEVAAGGNFAAAAMRLGLAPSTLTETIQHIEEMLGLKLFHRTTRKVELTASAAEFLPVAQRLIRDFDDAWSDLAATASGERGQVVIACAAVTIDHLVGPAVKSFIGEYPGVCVVVRHGRSAEVEDLVMSNIADIGVVRLASGNPALETRSLLYDPVGLLCRPRHALAAGDGPARWKDLAGFGYVAVGGKSDLHLRIQGDPVASAMVPPPRHEVQTTSVFARLLDSGDAFSLTTELLAGLPAYRPFKFRTLVEPALEQEVCLVTRRQRALTPSAERMLASLQRTVDRSDIPPGVRRASPSRAG